jgi:hypothetical protein
VYVNGSREHLKIQFNYGRNSLTMEETLPDKRNLEKLTREGKSLVFYTAANNLKL